MRLFRYFLLLLAAELLCGGVCSGCRKRAQSALQKTKESKEPPTVAESPRLSGHSVEKMRRFLKNRELSRLRLRTKEEVVALFGKENVESVTLRENRSPDQKCGNREFYVTQQHNGLPVFAASALLQAELNGELTYVYFNFSEAVSGITDKAQEFSPALWEKLFPAPSVCILQQKSVIFDPALVKRPGAASVVWMIDTGIGDVPVQRYFVDQKTQQIVWEYPLLMNHTGGR